jgi:two-component system chemotaxis response regulator CheB
MDQLMSVIVVGASTGGVQAIGELLEKTPPTIKAAIFIVLHVSGQPTVPALAQYLQKKTSLKCSIAQDKEPIKEGHVYIAAPNFHTLVTSQGLIRVIKGSHENRWRPSIDVLFRSAASAYTSRVTGIILTGMLDDGVSGMWAIKQCGGTCIMQEPDEIQFWDMPVHVPDQVEVDYRVPIADIGCILDNMSSKLS